jgi:hypothetical protein
MPYIDDLNVSLNDIHNLTSMHLLIILYLHTLPLAFFCGISPCSLIYPHPPTPTHLQFH